MYSSLSFTCWALCPKLKIWITCGWANYIFIVYGMYFESLKTIISN